MNNFLNIIKNIFPKEIRTFIHKIYFNFLMIPLEKSTFFKKLYFKNYLLPDYQNIIDHKTQSLIRHNLYENYEIEAIKKVQLWDNNFIDLGSSIGLCSLIVSSNMSKEYKHILVEPNKKLLDYSKIVISSTKHNNNFFINKAINYGSNSSMFNEGRDILSGKTIPNNLNKDYKTVECTTLNKILEEHNINSFNILIDIEGLSFLPLFRDEDAFRMCRKLVLEEKYSDEYNLEKVQNQFEKLGFKIIYNSEARGSRVIGAIKN
jgi:FkbM family methyltransferase